LDSTAARGVRASPRPTRRPRAAGSESTAGPLSPAHGRGQQSTRGNAKGPSRPPARCRRRPTAAIEAGSESSSGPGPLPPPAHGGDRGGVRVVLRPQAAAGPRWRSRRGPSRPPARCRRQPTAAIEARSESSSGAGSLAWPQASRRACCARHPGRLLLDPVRTTISIFKVISLSPLLSFLSFLLCILLFLHSLRLLTPRSSPCLRPRFFLLYPAP
jgi:hypothetical protein